VVSLNALNKIGLSSEIKFPIASVHLEKVKSVLGVAVIEVVEPQSTNDPVQSVVPPAFASTTKLYSKTLNTALNIVSDTIVTSKGLSFERNSSKLLTQ